MFAVTDDEPGKDFRGVTGFPHFEGSQVFPAGVAGIYPIPEGLFVALVNGQVLKVQGTGGTGANMFNVHSDPNFNAFVLGTQDFQGVVSCLTQVGGSTLAPSEQLVPMTAAAMTAMTETTAMTAMTETTATTINEMAQG